MRMQTFFCPNFEADRREKFFLYVHMVDGGDNIV